ncbi:MAG: NAD(P)-dependent oxidoreductase, partial [Flavobacterium sp.]|nr:NAD(P)-dependent oxidoreductase [Flavobacterium sp.]
AEREEQKCYRENSEGPALLAQICTKLKIKFVTFSSDLVFDGMKSEPYVESDAPNPRSVYGKSKVRAEESVLKLNPSALIIRTSAFFSPHDVHNFIHHVLKTIESGETFPAPNDVVSPTYVPHLVSATLDLLIDDEDGIWHLCNNKAISWFDLAKFAAMRAGFDPELIVQQSSQTSHQPLYTAMTSERGNLLPSLDKALDEYFANVVTTGQMQSTNRHS